MGMIFVDYAWIINGRSFKFRLFSAILMIITINVQNYFQLISSYKIPVKKEKTLT